MIKGGGDVGSAVAHLLFTNGYQPVIVESPNPATTRRNMSFATAVFEGTIELEGVSRLNGLRLLMRSPTYLSRESVFRCISVRQKPFLQLLRQTF